MAFSLTAFEGHAGSCDTITSLQQGRQGKGAAAAVAAAAAGPEPTRNVNMTLLAALPPQQARSSHTITAVGDTIYLFGGEHAPRVPIGSDVYAYSLQERVWRKLQVGPVNMPPQSRAHMAVMCTGGTLSELAVQL